MRGILDGAISAARSIARSPLRASLTVLGILIGVAAVVTVTALGSGARDNVARQIQAIGSNFVVVFPQASQASGAHGAQGSGMRLTEDDGRAILGESTSVVAVAPALRSGAQVVYGDRNWSTSCIGTTLAYFEVRSWAVTRGSLWLQNDELLKSKVVVVGATVAKNLFGAEDPVGRTIRLGRYPYRVLGVLAEKGEAPFGGDQDDVVIMPSSSFRARVTRTPPGFAGALMASARSPDATDRAVAQIDSILRQRHHVEDGREPDFVIHTQKEFAEMQDHVYRILTALLVFVAAISLAVGGIGVMNIMLVSVTERTREIGIRMAIGAREQDIRTQFLVEAVALAVMGGLAGVAVGALATGLLQRALEWHMALALTPIVVSVAVSAAVGVGFGFFPARRAARLDPIEALRHE
ncbi:MAG TPA: ABC transporter permease [Polyangiaceae bacterium]|nr:ABC transporter permease [Polyangiaceae bacterium]